MKTINKSGKVIRLNMLPVNQDSDQIHMFAMPVIRIDYKGRILYANKASFPILKEWNCLANDYIPDELIRQHPALLDLQAGFDMNIETKSTQYHLDVVGFNECGYIGLYGYKTETLELKSENTGSHAAMM